MIALVDVELRRFLYRRVVRLFAFLILVGFLIAGVAAFIRSHEPDVPAFARENIARDMERCLDGRGPQWRFTVEGDRRDFCEEAVSAQYGIQDRRLHMADFTDTAAGMTGFFVPIAVLLAASFVGAEWNHRTITTSLTWEPRRWRLLAAKLIAAVSIAIVATILFQALLMLLLTPAAVFRGTTEGIGGDWFVDLVWTILRSAGLAGVGAALGFSIAAIGRNTAAALGVMFVYIAVLEPSVRAWRPGLYRYLLSDNFVVFVTDNYQLNVFGAEHSRADATLVLIAYVAIVFAAAGYLFRRRDVA